ncbi:MAG: ATP-dependent chaperone ClpB, partial [Coriobacteriia bacterium]|nr:ATP-dependent chaperone ClpB [Coriobacteriia bacterium]
LERDRITMKVTPGAMGSLALGGLDPVFGARPLRRLIQAKVVDGIANLIIDGVVGEGDVVLVDADENGEIVVTRDDAASEAAKAARGGEGRDRGEIPVEPDSVE